MGEESERASLEKFMIIFHVGIIVVVRITKKDLRSKSIEITYYIDFLLCQLGHTSTLMIFSAVTIISKPSVVVITVIEIIQYLQ
jgi:hypothetical protein